jgi:hypothetical protein
VAGWAGRAEKCLVDFQLADQFSIFEFHWSNAVQQKIIRHQFNGLGKDHSSDETSPVF